MSNKIQTSFLQKLIQEELSVTIFLIGGTKLQGILVGQDEDVLLLRRDAHTQLIYKHAISTVMPSAAVMLDK